MRQNTTMKKNILRVTILEFAMEHGLVIHPGGYERNIDMMATGCCPSSKTECPCPGCLADIETNGKCGTGMFLKDYSIAIQSSRGALREYALQHQEEEEQPIDDELVAALIGLGYKTKDAKNAAREVPADMSLEDKVKYVLKEEKCHNNQ